MRQLGLYKFNYFLAGSLIFLDAAVIALKNHVIVTSVHFRYRTVSVTMTVTGLAFMADCLTTCCSSNDLTTMVKDLSILWAISSSHNLSYFCQQPPPPKKSLYWSLKLALEHNFTLSEYDNYLGFCFNQLLYLNCSYYPLHYMERDCTLTNHTDVTTYMRKVRSVIC